MLLEMLPEAIFGAFVSEVFSNCTGITKEKIKNAVKNRKIKHQNLEFQIYNITIDVLNKITGSRYKDQDIIFDTAEELLGGFQNEKNDNVDAIRNALRNLVAYVSDDTCEEFIKVLCHELSKDDYVELYREIMLLQGEQERRKASRIENKVDALDQKMEKGFNEVKQGLENINKDSKEIDIEREEKFKNNKKQDYIDNWNSRLFLHLDNNENPITLADAFIMPDFVIHKSIERIGFSDDDTLEQMIGKFVKYNRTSTMLITGVPGMGKTTITSWLANKYETDENVIILRFRDWERKELKQGLLKTIYESLECKKKDLENRVLILDGFDEIKALDIRDNVLSEFVSELKDFENLKCIITSRPAYIDAHYFQNLIEIKEFDLERVHKFYEEITGKVLDKKKTNKSNLEGIDKKKANKSNLEGIDELYEMLMGKVLDKKKTNKSNLEVLGIPVILYMAIMSDIDISENPTKPELYNRIFAEKGGIFDKFFDGETQYESGDQILRKPENIIKYLEFLSDTAFRMFEKGELQLEKHEYKDIKLEFKKKEVSVLEFPIKHLFEDTANNIEFVHKSIYEYFVSEYIFCKIGSAINKNGSKEELAGVFGGVLKRNILSDEILECLKYKITNKVTDTFDAVQGVFQLMLQDGMTYYTGECYKNVIECEMNVFANMLEIMHLWNWKNLQFERKMNYYIGHIGGRRFNLSKMNLLGMDLEGVNLKGANLKGANLRIAKLREANLEGADLEGADLEGANLEGVDLERANLERADLIGTDLRGANLERANLEGANLRTANIGNVNLNNTVLASAIFDEKQVSDLEKQYNLQGIQVFINDTMEVVSYAQYRNRQ